MPIRELYKEGYYFIAFSTYYESGKLIEYLKSNTHEIRKSLDRMVYDNSVFLHYRQFNYLIHNEDWK